MTVNDPFPILPPATNRFSEICPYSMGDRHEHDLDVYGS
jgi:hypothetical protein